MGVVDCVTKRLLWLQGMSPFPSSILMKEEEVVDVVVVEELRMSERDSSLMTKRGDESLLCLLLEEAIGLRKALLALVAVSFMKLEEVEVAKDEGEKAAE